MSVELENVVQLYDEGVNYGKIGVSKRIDSYTFAEISDYLYAGVSTDQFKNCKAPLTGVYRKDCTAPIKISVNNYTGDVTAIEGEGEDTGDVYCKVIWCYTSVNGVDLLRQQTLSINDSGVYIITNMDASKIIIQMTTTRSTDWGQDWSTRQALSFSDEGKAMDFLPNCYYQDNGVVNFNPSGTDSHRHLLNSIAPFLIVPAGDSFILFNAVYARTIGGGYGPVVNDPPSTQYNYLTAINGNRFAYAPVCTPTPPLTQSWYAYGLSLYGINTAGDNYSLYFLFSESDRYYWWRYVPNSHDKLLLYMIRSGVFIYTDKLYKPVISGGYISGYTDDAGAESDIDMYTYAGGNKHDVPPSPPSPAPSGDEDNDDPIPTVAAPYASGLARYYITTAGSLVLMHISEALGAWDLKDTRKDLYKNLISCKLIKPPTAVPSSSSVFEIYGIRPQYQGSDITIPEVTGNPSISFGSYSIPRKFNDFRDYAPYTKVEIYLPYCGWTPLPSHVVGRSVSVTYYTDIIAATCKAVVYCGANVVAEAAGVIGMDIPMVAENAGAKAEAVTAGLLAYGKAGLQTALGVGAAVATKGKAGVTQAATGIGNLISSYSQTAMAFNTSFTEVNGKNGDGCCIAGISAIVIKITRPKYGANSSAPYVPAEYGHTIGYTSMKTVTVGSVTGLLIAENVDTSGISGATERERQLIKLYLESGIFVEHPS